MQPGEFSKIQSKVGRISKGKWQSEHRLSKNLFEIIYETILSSKVIIPQIQTALSGGTLVLSLHLLTH